MKHSTRTKQWSMRMSVVVAILAGCDEEDMTPIDPEPNIYVEWFSDYNAGQGVDYLDDTGTLFPEGSDEVAASHRYIENASYGPFSRNVIDVFLPKNATSKTPIVLYFHGGGFTGGDKDRILDGKADVDAYLEQGIAVASANYRFGSSSDKAALDAPIPNGECDGSDDGCRKDYIFRDGARAVQYLRHFSDELNIDPDKIAVFGSSAGGQIAMWVATVPDLAVSDHEDPVLQQSTRVAAVGHLTSQASSISSDWPELLDFSDTLWNALRLDEGVDQGLQMTVEDLRGTGEGQSLMNIVDTFGSISADDPPIVTACNTANHSEEALLHPDNADDARGWFVHHPKHSTPIYEQCLQFDLDCGISTQIRDEGDSIDASAGGTENIQAFLTDRLLSAP